MTPNARARAAAVKRRLTELKLKQARAEQELQRTEEQLEARRREVERKRLILQQESELEQAREEERLLSEPDHRESDYSSGGVASGVAWQGSSRGYQTHQPHIYFI